jgi:fibronectin type 3 domain-containing protein
MKLKLIVALFALATLSGVAGAQQTASKPLTLSVNHQVVLMWQASTTSGVTQYNIYRGIASGGPYLLIASDNALDYNDVPGTGTWYYVVTAVGSDGVESVYSNQAFAVVPAL